MKVNLMNMKKAHTLANSLTGEKRDLFISILKSADIETIEREAPNFDCPFIIFFFYWYSMKIKKSLVMNETIDNEYYKKVLF